MGWLEWLWGDVWRRILLLIVCVAVAALIVRATSGSSGQKAPCAVLSNGNKLCGDDLAAWCNGEATRLADEPSTSYEDANTQTACQQVGVTLPAPGSTSNP